MELTKETLTYLKRQSPNRILAVYLSGSRLNNLADEDSDTDYYVVTEPEFDSLIFNRRKGKQNHNEIDFKQVDLFQFVNSIYKSNPNVLELFYKQPLYVNPMFIRMSEFLSENKDRLLTLNPDHWRKACLGQMKHSYLNVLKQQGSTAKGLIGKDIVQFLKAYSYLSATLAGKGLGDSIDINTETHGFASEMKSYDVVSDEERNQVATFMKNQFEDIQKQPDLNDTDTGLFIELLDIAKQTYTILCVSELSGLKAVE
ncbi:MULTISPECIES: DNA polymerase beta superfamily protein [unclassified Levilactobacillus]|uniref:DNA polymerase beta superfamily protein n=1 Tax=unclassified Levilactobacillus TaxID=2767918 RepID=UPI002FEEA1A7